MGESLKNINDIRRKNANAIYAIAFKSNAASFAEALDVERPFLGRILNDEAAQPRNIGDALARKIERAGGKPENWLDNDHEVAFPELSSLRERYRSSSPEIQALIRLALDDAEVPIPEAVRPSLRMMIEAVRMTVAQNLTPPDE